MPAQIVVVLNDTALTDQAVEALRGSGYEALAIHDPMAALQALESASGVELLVTSGDFPRGPNGLSIARMARLKCPDLRTLFIGPALIADTVSKDGMYLAVPTTAMQVAATVTEMMKQNAASR
jgi:hypothetical protein